PTVRAASIGRSGAYAGRFTKRPSYLPMVSTLGLLNKVVKATITGRSGADSVSSVGSSGGYAALPPGSLPPPRGPPPPPPPPPPPLAPPPTPRRLLVPSICRVLHSAYRTSGIIWWLLDLCRGLHSAYMSPLCRV